MKAGNLLNFILRSMALGYQKQLDKYMDMYLLAQKQRESIENDRWLELEEIIEKRYFLLTQLEKLNKSMKPLQEDIVKTLNLEKFSSKAILEAVPSKTSQQLADTVAKIGDVLYKIKVIDNINEKLLQEKISRLRVKTDLDKKMGKREKNIPNFGKIIEAANLVSGFFVVILIKSTRKMLYFMSYPQTYPHYPQFFCPHVEFNKNIFRQDLIIRNFSRQV